MMIARRRSSRTKTQNLAYNLITIVAVLHHPKSDLFPTATSFLPHEPSPGIQNVTDNCHQDSVDRISTH
jgi:hypothetical protein